jgi:hypothetical protein
MSGFEGAHELGYFGNIWVKQNVLLKAGQYALGHTHEFDHVSLLTQGSALVEVDGCEPKVFKSPVFIVIKKEHRHKFTALEDKTMWYCVFAMRNLDGEVVNSQDEIYSSRNNPYSDKSSGDVEALDEATTKYTD